MATVKPKGHVVQLHLAINDTEAARIVKINASNIGVTLSWICSGYKNLSMAGEAPAVRGIGARPMQGFVCRLIEN